MKYPIVTCLKIFLVIVLCTTFPPVAILFAVWVLVKLFRHFRPEARAWRRQLAEQAYYDEQNSLDQRYHREVARAFRNR